MGSSHHDVRTKPGGRDPSRFDQPPPTLADYPLSIRPFGSAVYFQTNKTLILPLHECAEVFIRDELLHALTVDQHGGPKRNPRSKQRQQFHIVTREACSANRSQRGPILCIQEMREVVSHRGSPNLKTAAAA